MESLPFFGQRKAWGWLRLDGQVGVSLLDNHQDFCNHVRPHEVLDQTLPTSRYLAEPDPVNQDEEGRR